METGWLLESWVEYAICIFIIVLRIISRTMWVGFRGWQGDDYLIFVVIAAFTLQMTNLQGINDNSMNIGLTAEKAAKLSEDELRRLSKGSLANVLLWLSYTTVLWSLKGCMLFLYRRLTIGLWQRNLVRIASFLVVITYIGCIATILFHCGVPIEQQWALRPPEACVAKTSMILANFYIVGTTNFTTDALLLFIPIPLLLEAKLPVKRKFIIALLLCSGVFVMAATSLRTILSIKSLYGSSTANWGMILSWIVREPFVAVIVVNAPCIKPLLCPTKRTPRRKRLFDFISSQDSTIITLKKSRMSSTVLSQQIKSRPGSVVRFVGEEGEEGQGISTNEGMMMDGRGVEGMGSSKRKSSSAANELYDVGKILPPRPSFLQASPLKGRFGNVSLNGALSNIKTRYSLPPLKAMVSPSLSSLRRMRFSNNNDDDEDDEEKALTPRTPEVAGSTGEGVLTPSNLTRELEEWQEMKVTIDRGTSGKKSRRGRRRVLSDGRWDESVQEWVTSIMEERAVHRRMNSNCGGEGEGEGEGGGFSDVELGTLHKTTTAASKNSEGESLWERRSLYAARPMTPLAVLR